MTAPTDLPYRLNVGAVLFNRSGLVFVGRRADLPPDAPEAWQFPQGGIDDGENPRDAVLRELAEEIGTANATILAEHPDWLTYDLPPALQGIAWGGKFRGQKQKWFALRFNGADTDIRLDADTHQEFLAWRWVPLPETPSLTVPFKRPIYENLAETFQRFSTSGG